MIKFYLFSMYSVQYNREFRYNLLRKCKEKTVGELTSKCKYLDYYNLILDSTPLPNVLIDLICVWINDDITLQIDTTKSKTVIKSYNTCMNFINMQFSFEIVNGYAININFGNNVVSHNSVSAYYIFQLYMDGISETNYYEKNGDIYKLRNRPICVKIIDHTLFSNICYLIRDVTYFVNGVC